MKMNNDFELLETMLNDSKAIDEIYRPTNYWNNYVDKMIDAIRTEDLNDIRSKSSVFTAFGGSDVQLDYFSIQKSKRIVPLTFLRYFARISSTISKGDLQRLAYYQASYYDNLYGINKLNEVSISNIWNPKDTFEMNGKQYSIAFLKYYLQYIYMSRFIDFNKVDTYVDLGTGMSKITEIIHKLHPNVTIILFDIVPTLYIVNRYMTALFPKETIGYETTREFSNLSNVKKGLIHILPNWKFPLIKTLSHIDVFVNSASFQEMEIPIVNNYLSIINQKARYIYLREVMNGKEKANSMGEHGNIEPVKIKDYLDNLKGYEIIDRSPSIFPLMSTAYEDMLFKLKVN